MSFCVDPFTSANPPNPQRPLQHREQRQTEKEYKGGCRGVNKSVPVLFLLHNRSFPGFTFTKGDDHRKVSFWKIYEDAYIINHIAGAPCYHVVCFCLMMWLISILGIFKNVCTVFFTSPGDFRALYSIPFLPNQQTPTNLSLDMSR